MLELFINNFDKIIGSFMIAVFGGYITYRIYKKTRFNDAAATFRDCVRTELDGFYQSKTSWGKTALPTIKEKVIKVRRYADTFSDFLNGSSKRDFVTAKKAYCDYCESITYEMCVQLDMYPKSSPMKPEVRDSRIIFDEHVNNLLSFAKEK